MEYYHVDVFSREPLSGNGLTVFLTDTPLETEYMQKLAKEFKQFETIFITRRSDNVFLSRIFTVEEELDFAGHPILGATSVIHQRYFHGSSKIQITIELPKKSVTLDSTSIDKNSYTCHMNQGRPEYMSAVKKEDYKKYLEPLNLSPDNLMDEYGLEVITTGLPYLLVPIKTGLEQTGIFTDDYEKRLSEIGAKFVYIFELHMEDGMLTSVEGRTWDNLGNVEDVATGSAAGPVGAYLYKHGLVHINDKIMLQQGRFLLRPSLIEIGQSADSKEIWIAGDSRIICKGDFF